MKDRTSYFDKRLQPWAKKNLELTYGIHMDDDVMYMHNVLIDPCTDPSRFISAAYNQFNAIQCYYRPDSANCYFLKKSDADAFHDACTENQSEGDSIHYHSRAALKYSSEIDFKLFLCRAFGFKTFDELDLVIDGENAIDALTEAYAYPEIEMDVAFANGIGLSCEYIDDSYDNNHNSVAVAGRWAISCGSGYSGVIKTKCKDLFLTWKEDQYRIIFYFMTERDLNQCIDVIIADGSYALSSSGFGLMTKYRFTDAQQEVYSIFREPRTTVIYKPDQFKKWIKRYKKENDITDDDSKGIEATGQIFENASYEEKCEAILSYARAHKMGFDRRPNLSLLLPVLNIRTSISGILEFAQRNAIENGAIEINKYNGGGKSQKEDTLISITFLKSSDSQKAAREIRDFYPLSLFDYSAHAVNIFRDVTEENVDAIIKAMYGSNDMDHITGTLHTAKIFEDFPTFNEFNK